MLEHKLGESPMSNSIKDFLRLTSDLREKTKTKTDERCSTTCSLWCYVYGKEWAGKHHYRLKIQTQNIFIPTMNLTVLDIFTYIALTYIQRPATSSH